MSKPKDTLRKFERDVLDPFHKTLPLWSRPRGEALLGLLAAYDGLNFLAISSPIPPIDPIHQQKFKSYDEGLTQALRWLFVAGVSVPDHVPQEIVEEAGRFLIHASEYVDVADLHMAYGRGFVNLTLDEKARRVEFSSTSLDSFAFIETVSTQARRDIPSIAGLEVSKFFELKAAIARVPFSIRGRRVVLDEPSVLGNPQFARIPEMLIPKAGFYLPENVDLDGFSVREFNEVWRAFVTWSFACEGLALNEVTRSRDLTAVTATQIVKTSDLIRELTQMSGVSKTAIERIVARLALDSRTARHDIFQQPLIVSGDRCMWSPRIVTQSRHQRNMLKLMARTPELSNLAATIIGDGERPLLRNFGALLAKRGGFQFKLRVPLRVGDVESDADLVAYTRKAPTELLVVEAKAVLPPDEVNEVARVTNDLIEAQRQVLGSVKLLREMPGPQRCQLFPFVDWQRVRRYCPLVLTPETAPVPPYDHTLVPGIGFETLKAHLRSRDFRSPNKLCSACQEREWMTSYLELEKTTKEVVIGDVTYVLPARRKPGQQTESPRPKESTR